MNPTLISMASMRRPLFLLGAALVCGLMAAWAARQHIQGRIQSIEAQARVPMVQRIVAAYALESGTRLLEEHLALRSFPATWAAPGSLAPERFRELLGRQLAGPVQAGDPVLDLHVQHAAKPAFSNQITPGRRAITMPVDRINSVSGLLQPGDLIDLYVSFDYQKRTITAPLLQGVMVLATDTRTRNDDHLPDAGSTYSTVTLDAAPEDAVKLVAARNSGSLTAVLRSSGDHHATTRAVRGDLASLLGVNRPAPERSKRAPVIYGAAGGTVVPRLVPGAGHSQQSGLFDLPQIQALVSSWVHQNSAQGNHFGAGYPPFSHEVTTGSGQFVYPPDAAEPFFSSQQVSSEAP